MQSNEIFDSVCTLIAAKYKDNNWKYSKTSHWMTKKDKNFMYKVFFYTSLNNISDKNVVFYGEFAIISLKTKNKIFNINSRQCNMPNGKLHWNIANKEDSHQAVIEFTDWLDRVCMPIIEKCTNDLDNFVDEVTTSGFYPPKGYIVDIAFILCYGSRELAEKASNKYYRSLEEKIQKEFRDNYNSLNLGNEAASSYGKNMMRNYSNFRTIIENKIKVDF